MSEKKGKAAKSKPVGKQKGKAGSAKDGQEHVLSVASHPRAAASIRQAKGWGGIGAFGLTAYLSLSHGVAPDMAGLRAIGAGVAGYVVAWGCGVMVWRQLMVAELRARVEHARRASEDTMVAAPAVKGADHPAPAQP